MHMWRTALRASSAVLLSGLLLVGCGSDDEDSSEPEAVVPEGWTVVIDEPSGIAVAMPEDVDPQEQDSPTSDGGTMKLRSYFMVADDIVEVGFNVLDLGGGTYDLDAGLEGVVGQIGGTVEDKEEITVDGHEAVQVEATVGDGAMTIFRLIVLDGHVLMPMVSSAEENHDQAEEYFGQLTGSIDLG